MTKNPIFIIGTERSGSNLLRVILTAHSKIWIPHPPHFMNYFGDLQYGDLSNTKIQKKVLQNMLRLVRYHIFPWTEHTLNPKEIQNNIKHPSMFGITAAIYEHVLPQTQKSIWGCKSTFMIAHIPAIKELYPQARFIFLVRDPRDVSLSSKTSVFSPCHPLLSARLWNAQQKLGLEAMKEYPESFHLLQYEDLLQDNQGTLEKLCAFLELELEPQMFAFFEQKEASKGAKLSESWKNTGKPIKKNNHGKWRTQLSPSEIGDVESQCFDTMQIFGYQPTTELPSTNAPYRQKRIDRKEKLLQAYVEYKSFRNDKNVFLRWRRDAYARYLSMRYGKRTDESSL